ncbi:MAG: tRNA pseudouridine(55) synthase TruB [Candidatus Sericytochromatia bacterium]|nr:tRNA pseudouridine(55) synthase TruB [Candidatus Sericytochromatia bacterium]
MQGWLVVDKPAGPTAHDIVARARRRLHFKRIGHSGTLDPPATGVMVLALGNATRLLRFLPGDKTYWGRVTFGVTTSTLDATGAVQETRSVDISQAAIEAALPPFRGLIEQQPPMVSAVHHEGKRLYELARAGQDVPDRPLRSVTVHHLEQLAWESPHLDLRVHCSTGTYIRTIADDLGRALGPGAHLSVLRRELANGFALDQAVDLETIEDAALTRAILPIDAPLLGMPAVHLAEADAVRFRHGNPVASTVPAGLVRVYDGETLLGVAASDGQTLTAEVVLVAG